MGMFDYLRCELPLPKTDVAPPVAVFQTKDTPAQMMDTYTITEQGYLVHQGYDLTRNPDAAPGNFIGAYKSTPRPPETVAFHGDIIFSAFNHPDVGEWTYRARFTEGMLSRITLETYRAPEGRDVTAEIQARRATFKPEDKTALPDGKADLALRERLNQTAILPVAYHEVEDALDQVEAPMQDKDGRWLSLPERILALQDRLKPVDEETGR